MGPNAAGTMPAPTTVEISFEFRVGVEWDMLTLHDKRQQTEQGKDKVLVPVWPILQKAEKKLYQHIVVQVKMTRYNMGTTYQRIILVVAGLRHQRQTVFIELEIRDGLLAILAASLKGRRALLHMGCIGHRGLYRAAGFGFRVLVHGERRYNIVEVVLCISLGNESSKRRGEGRSRRNKKKEMVGT